MLIYCINGEALQALLFKALTWETSTLETVQCLFDSTFMPREMFCIKKTLYLCCTIQRTVKQILVKNKTVKTAATKEPISSKEE